MGVQCFKTKGMTNIPKIGEYFRVGKYVGLCILRLPHYVIMKIEV